MRPIFCGNFEFDARQSDLERIFRRYGKVDRVDMKSGFAFVYMEDERDAEDAIRGLDRSEFGRKGRRLRVEWTKERGPRRPVASRRSANLRPSKTLFVINFPYHTRTKDLERHFDPYGKILNVRIRRNFAFVQYESQEDATRALDATNMSKLMDRVISVEYAAREDDVSRDGYSPDRKGRNRSPQRRRRSPSPYERERGSPDYGHGSSPAPYRRERGSPDYGRGSGRSPSPRRGGRSSPNYEHARDERTSPDYRHRSRSPRQDERASPHYPAPGPSPNRKEVSGPDYPDHSPIRPREVRSSPDYPVRTRSPQQEEKSGPDYPEHSPSPRRDVRVSPEYGDCSASPQQEQRVGNSYGHHPSNTAYDGEESSPEYGHEHGPNSKPGSGDSPKYEDERD
ncbi:hypothetical protein Ancab_009263 [Ancistrocladus abbreviatus]